MRCVSALWWTQPSTFVPLRARRTRVPMRRHQRHLVAGRVQIDPGGLARVEEGLGLEPEGVSASGWVADLQRVRAELAQLRSQQW